VPSHALDARFDSRASATLRLAPIEAEGAMRAGIRALASTALASASSGALAVAIVAATPQGEVAQVRQVTVKFGEAVVPFGDLRLPDPFTIACRGADVPAGSGRWANDRVWLYDFKEPLGPGTTCTAT